MSSESIYLNNGFLIQNFIRIISAIRITQFKSFEHGGVKDESFQKKQTNKQTNKQRKMVKNEKSWILTFNKSPMQ